LKALENLNQRAHFDARHGAGTTLEQQQIRAQTGLTPDNVQMRPIDASRWLDNEHLWEGQQRAKLVYERTGQEAITVVVK
jgi:filamentous hemagglutinin